ncbi:MULTISPECIES: DUF4440 domain-containing protein [unclassified Clostridium]|uniref:nuclear transport factor 2 family protein n=1 Tax=unclassified Clostridium TaxID=2614128 RepID=UPI0002977BBA|nr:MULTISPECIES: DUF4440 domain-containing protein [unclassified Clostridium]EKQ53606.1 MAG: hypothetical protein A370_03651 [Clostridium sp. Maddingley MBC34-26]
MESIEMLIVQNENELLKSEIRKSPQKIKEILADDFIEYTSSGSEYHYKSGDVFQEQNDSNELFGQIIDFKIKQLSDNCILATYKLVKHNELNENKKYSLRSSIWKCFDGRWKMIFHQGTLTAGVNL